MLSKLRALNNRGDTIVEVMIVLAVLGLAIGISYATANRSLLNARQAQESSQATALVQSQIEALRSLSNDATQNIYQPGPYCISQSAPYTIVTGGSCVVGSIPYTLAVTYTNPTFTVTATWDDVKGEGKDTATLSYRVYEPSTQQVAGVGTCPAGQTGTPPNCIPASCPAGQTGTPPDCVTPTCPEGQTGTPPDCIAATCPTGQTGTPPNCVTPPQFCTIFGIQYPIDSIVCKFLGGGGG